MRKRGKMSLIDSWNAEVRTLRFALTEKSCNLIGPFVPRDLYTRR